MVEVLVAVAVLGLALGFLLSLRGDSVLQAAEARNLRFARALAYQVLSEIQAGEHKVYDMRSLEQTRDGFQGFKFKIFVGETEIQNEESLLAETKANAVDASDADQRSWERQQWLNERNRVDRARSSGQLVSDVRDEELEVDDSPDEDTYEDIAVYVYYPLYGDNGEEPGVYRLRSRASTLALSGLTNEQAQDKQEGLTTDQPEGQR